jgi:hypothetical protein
MGIPVSLYHQDHRLLTKVAMVAGMAQQHELSFTKVNMSIVTIWVSKLTRWETSIESLIKHHSLGWSDSHLVAGWQWRSWNGHFLCIQIALPTDTASAQSIICWVTQCLIYSHGIASGRGPPFPASECGSGPCSWITHLTYSSPSLFLN